MKQCIYWLIAIDGTSSKDYRTRMTTHVNKLYEEFKETKENKKAILDGPREHRFKDSNNGSFSRQIKQEALNKIKEFEKASGHKIEVINGDAFLNQKQLKICFVGYSRGAVICIDTSFKLYKERKIKTHFLGLLDPVKRDPYLDGKIDLTTIRKLHIARRSLKANSRYWFGYAGRVISLKNNSFQNVIFNELSSLISSQTRGRFYDTSHGGMGGAEEYKSLSFSDKYFNLSEDGYCSPARSIKTVWKKNPKKEMCRTESQRVYDDLKAAAKEAGLF